MSTVFTTFLPLRADLGKVGLEMHTLQHPNVAESLDGDSIALGTYTSPGISVDGTFLGGERLVLAAP